MNILVKITKLFLEEKSAMNRVSHKEINKFLLSIHRIKDLSKELLIELDRRIAQWYAVRAFSGQMLYKF